MNSPMPLQQSGLPRRVGVEELDHLAPTDPKAARSRRDLYRINRFMRTASIVTRALSSLPGDAPQSIVELGCGDGRIMLDIAKRLCRIWPQVRLTLIDRQALVDQRTLAAFGRLGWQTELVVDDAMQWARGQSGKSYDLIFCNLFIHHFDDRTLADLLGAISLCTQRFLACEPRRERLPLFGSHLVGLLGTNAVTRSDAVLSVHAGFRGDELSRLWRLSSSGPWHLQDYCAGLFNQCFLAYQESQ